MNKYCYICNNNSVDMELVNCETCLFEKNICETCFNEKELLIKDFNSTNKKTFHSENIVDNHLILIKDKVFSSYIIKEDFSEYLSNPYFHNNESDVCHTTPLNICFNCDTPKLREYIIGIIPQLDAQKKEYYDYYFNWCRGKKTDNCSHCNQKSDFYSMDKIFCAKRCGWNRYECDDCNQSFGESDVTIHKSKDYRKYILKTHENSLIIAYICSRCHKENDIQKLKDNYLKFISNEPPNPHTFIFNIENGKRLWPPPWWDYEIESIFK